MLFWTFATAGAAASAAAASAAAGTAAGAAAAAAAATAAELVKKTFLQLRRWKHRISKKIQNYLRVFSQLFVQLCFKG